MVSFLVQLLLAKEPSQRPATESRRVAARRTSAYATGVRLKESLPTNRRMQTKATTRQQPDCAKLESWETPRIGEDMPVPMVGSVNWRSHFK